MALTEKIAIHDQHLARLTAKTSPTLREGFGVGAHSAAELLILFGDNPDPIRSEAAFAKLCGTCPIPASSGRTTGRHRLNRGGHRHANAALYRAVIVVRMRYHQPTVDDVARRTADGRTKREIIRCLKRFLARKIYQRVMTEFRARRGIVECASRHCAARRVNLTKTPRGLMAGRWGEEGAAVALYGRSGRRARTCYPGCLQRIRTPSAVYDQLAVEVSR